MCWVPYPHLACRYVLDDNSTSSETCAPTYTDAIPYHHSDTTADTWFEDSEPSNHSARSKLAACSNLCIMPDVYVCHQPCTMPNPRRTLRARINSSESRS